MKRRMFATCTHNTIVMDRQELYNGKVFNVEKMQVNLQDNAHDDPVATERDVVHHKDSVAVVALNTFGDLHMVRQDRQAVGRSLLEIPAGVVEDGETSMEAALRELNEECGLVPTNLLYLGAVYPTPGYVDEVHYLYLATGCLYAPERGLDDDEFITGETAPFNEVWAQLTGSGVPSYPPTVDDREVVDSKTALAVMRAHEYMCVHNMDAWFSRSVPDCFPVNGCEVGHEG